MEHDTQRRDDSEETTRTEPAARGRGPPTNGGRSGVGTATTVIAVLLAVPLFMGAVVMPLAAVAGGGAMMSGAGGLRMFVPLVPLTVLGVLVYTLYTYGGGSDRPTSSDGALAELRAAYARGELSDEEFERRRERLRPGSAAERREATRHE